MLVTRDSLGNTMRAYIYIYIYIRSKPATVSKHVPGATHAPATPIDSVLFILGGDSPLSESPISTATSCRAGAVSIRRQARLYPEATILRQLQAMMPRQISCGDAPAAPDAHDTATRETLMLR